MANFKKIVLRCFLTCVLDSNLTYRKNGDKVIKTANVTQHHESFIDLALLYHCASAECENYTCQITLIRPVIGVNDNLVFQVHVVYLFCLRKTQKVETMILQLSLVHFKSQMIGHAPTSVNGVFPYCKLWKLFERVFN